MNRSFLRTVCLWAILSIAALATTSAAHAQVFLFDNLANTSQGFSSVTDNSWQAQRFNTDSNNLLLTRAVLKLYSETGGSGTFFLRLFSDAAGIPGTSLATLASGPNPITGTLPQTVDVAFDGLSQPLLPNTDYWMVFGDNAGPPLDLRWGVANPPGGGSGFQAINASTGNQGAGWLVMTGTAQQMQLTATIVPEPASMLLGLVGSGGLLLVRRLRKR